jgi:DNA-directed RNA polymerase subunit beta'
MTGRFPAVPIAVDPTGEVLCDTDTMITEEIAASVIEAGVDRVLVRSSLTCEAERGICKLLLRS